jgi:formamidopyrimidine-DNA glycosylase
MPELPEVEVIARSLGPKIRGSTIQSFKVFYPPILRHDRNADLQSLIGQRIRQVQRRGKMVLIKIAGARSLLFHLKMTGQLIICNHLEPLDKHTHLCFSFKEEARELRFRDVRKFGFLATVPTDNPSLSPYLKDLGPEPLEIEFGRFVERLQNRRGRIKSLLLNQNVIAGIGNIYANEILYRAKIHPCSSAALLSEGDLKRLWKSMRKILHEAIEYRGSSIQNFVDAEGQKGQFQSYHSVYRRDSLPCLVCGNTIHRLLINGRSTFVCLRCQPASFIEERIDKSKNRKKPQIA